MVPHQKHDSSATCHRSHFGHTEIPAALFSLWPGLFPSLLIPPPSTFDFSPLSYPTPLWHEFSNPSCFPCPNNCVCFPQQLSFPHSKISASIAHTLNLACNFTGSGRQSCLTSLCVPTIDGYYRSQPDFMVGHNLPSDIALSDDWVCPCQLVLVEGHSMIRRPCPLLLDWSSSLHYWYPVAVSRMARHRQEYEAWRRWWGNKMMREEYGTWGNEGERREERGESMWPGGGGCEDQHRIRAMQAQD